MNEAPRQAGLGARLQTSPRPTPHTARGVVRAQGCVSKTPSGLLLRAPLAHTEEKQRLKETTDHGLPPPPAGKGVGAGAPLLVETLGQGMGRTTEGVLTGPLSSHTELSSMGTLHDPPCGQADPKALDRPG